MSSFKLASCRQIKGADSNYLTDTASFYAKILKHLWNRIESFAVILSLDLPELPVTLFTKGHHDVVVRELDP